jgi:SH3-like domain-containing protein
VRFLSALVTLIALMPGLIAYPTMASLKAKRAFVRTGPGKCYPIKWILVHPTTPLKVIESFDMWRHVEDPLGGQGWIHKSLLWSKLFVYVIQETYLRKYPNDTASPQARVEKGAFMLLKRAEGDWLYVVAEGFRGYLPQKACWCGPLYAALK